MTNEERVERLAHILEEHECWEHPGWKGGRRRGHIVKRAFICTEIDIPSPEGQDTNWSVLRDAIREVESGAIFGSPDRCCVCGSDTEGGLPRRVRRYRMFQAEHEFHAHRGCYLLIEAAADQLQISKPWSREKEIIRARRLHREKAKRDRRDERTCETCVRPNCSSRGRWLLENCLFWRCGEKPKRPCDHSWKLVEERKAVSLWTCEKCEEAWIRPKPPRVSETWGMECHGLCYDDGFVTTSEQRYTVATMRFRLAGTGVKAVVPAGCAQPWPKPPQPSEEMVERVADALDSAYVRHGANMTAMARAAIREVLR